MEEKSEGSKENGKEATTSEVVPCKRSSGTHTNPTEAKRKGIMMKKQKKDAASPTNKEILASAQHQLLKEVYSPFKAMVKENYTIFCLKIFASITSEKVGVQLS